MDGIKLRKYLYLLFLLVICLLGIIINHTYAKFTSSYTTDDTIAELSYDFNVSISNIEEYEMINVLANSYEIFNVDINNSLSNTVYYGVWYQIVNSTNEDDIVVARVDNSSNDVSGSVNSNSTKTVTVIIKNDTSSNIKVKVGVGSSSSGVGDIKYFSDKKLITEVSSVPFQNFLLSTVEPGSYVAYTGNNGCIGSSCNGENDNSVGGFRVGYIYDSTVYLVAAGVTDLLCTLSDGTLVEGKSYCPDYDMSDGAVKHLSNLDSYALKYCNSSYAYGGTCDNSNSWAMDDNDFEKIMGSVLSISSCYNSSYDVNCGYKNDLIDNGEDYWYASSTTTFKVFYWNDAEKVIDVANSDGIYGLRPVLRLSSSVYVTGGTGTYEDPYTIAND